jgi:hypothetical protein
MADIDNLTAAVGFYITFCISITYITTGYTKKPLQKQRFIDFTWRRKNPPNNGFILFRPAHLIDKKYSNYNILTNT